MKCPHCESESVAKVIAAGLPMKLCVECNSIWGEPWAFIYMAIFAPIEGFFSGGFYFMSYQGSYIKGLWKWLTIKQEE